MAPFACWRGTGTVLAGAVSLGCQTTGTPSERVVSAELEAPSNASANPAPRVPRGVTQSDATAVASPTCRVQPGHRSESIAVGDVERRFELWIGPQARAGAPLLVLWHGWGGNPARALALAEPRTYWADAIVVAPQGLPRSFDVFGTRMRDGWQVASGEAGDRDLALFDALVAHLGEQHCIDSKRVYAAGFSNGGYFSNLLGCVRGEVVAAIAPTGGGGPWSTCDGEVAVSIMHGRRDDVVAYAQAEKSAQAWARHNECSSVPNPPHEGCTRSECKGAPLEFCSFDGGHRWPAGRAEHMAAFLRGFAKP